MWYDPCRALLQVLKSEKGVYYAVDGVKPNQPLGFRYLKFVLCSGLLA